MSKIEQFPQNEDTQEAIEKPKIENLDEYEKEKIEMVLKDAEHLVAVIKNYLEMVKYCDENGIKIKGRTNLEKLRYEGQPAGPGSDLYKIAQKFESGQLEIAKNLTQEQGDKIYNERIKPREERELG